MDSILKTKDLILIGEVQSSKSNSLSIRDVKFYCGSEDPHQVFMISQSS